MNNPSNPKPSAEHRDTPAVPNVVERPLERAADRAAMHDNPVVPNAIERPVERAVAGDRGAAVTDRPGTARSPVVDRPFVDDGPGDRPGVIDTPSEIGRGATTTTTS